MRKFFIRIKNNKVWFDDNDLKHFKSLRINNEDIIDCIDQNNSLVKVKIKSLDPIKSEIIEIKENKLSNKPYDITCFLGVIKKQNFELAVVKLSELNIKKIIPVYFDYSQRNINLNYQRLDILIKESQKQCNRIAKLEIDEPITFNDMVNKLNDFNCNFIAYEHQDLSEWNKIKNNSNLNNISYIVGPEGGFSGKEINELKNKCIFLKLTNTILKTETASIYLASILIERFFNEK
ncbi:16S rRNA (uracil(1498)-N(3))-methyltransferase [Malacoplasma penetrans]|uniref:Ribosomal RNA small subunit methyltransferase E n=1 Tax=Malacoplasma penetrans (strain HF-2) TaxID=272633 RepID=Q8EWP2_MALP2|nr:16S rRNA (uracil(1498)-N(3))-methyltransferase [Malacoplasma penetrans]RXY96985.1 16S rRNA (uracil(1498)-N(3))-methyltransferase [Malacoplasma penetrans]BAC43952.1 conserved hypothetical protein [Malacoplasma penetrans HF-2]